MDPFTLALATFGVQKLRGKSTKRALRDAAISCSGGTQLAGMAGVGPTCVLSHRKRMVSGGESGTVRTRVGTGSPIR
jgi:hypothetical protein